MFFRCRDLVLTALIAPGILLAALAGCKHEERDVSASPSEAAYVGAIPSTDLVPGTNPATSPATQPSMISPKEFEDSYANNAFALSQGQQLYKQYNCNTCHANGGGDIGPPLIDNKWIYGGEPQQIFATIVQGRPNGMPAWGTKLNEQQTWQLTAYIRSMSGLAAKNWSPGREDHMKTTMPPNSTPPQPPMQTSSPPSGEQPQ